MIKNNILVEYFTISRLELNEFVKLLFLTKQTVTCNHILLSCIIMTAKQT